jgi:sarcosine oxidase subunit gamma
MATIVTRKRKSDVLAQRMRAVFSVELPCGPRRATAASIAVVGTGPGAWLATQERTGNTFAKSLAQTLEGLGAVCDQSDAYAVLRLAGAAVREALSKVVPIDVHASAFDVGDVAATVAAHVGVILWRLEDDPDGKAVFEIAIRRSFAASFWRALSEVRAVSP